MKRLETQAYGLFLISGMVAVVVGVVLLKLAARYALPVSTMTLYCSSYSIGYVFVNLFMPRMISTFGMKQSMLWGLSSVVFGLLGSAIAPNVFLFSFFLFLFGLGVGSCLFMGSQLVFTLFPKERASKSNLLNFFYSVGAILLPLLLARLFLFTEFFQISFLIPLIILLPLLLSVWGSDFSTIENDEDERRVDQSPNRVHWFLSSALFFYVYSETVFISFVVTYVVHSFDIPIAKASIFLSLFWVFVAIGRFLYQYLLKLFKTRTVLLFSTFIVPVLYHFLIVETLISRVYLWVSLLGFFYSGLFPTILAYGTPKRISKPILSLLVTAGGLGGLFVMPTMGLFLRVFGVQSSLVVSQVTMGLVFLSVLTALVLKKGRTQNTIPVSI